jgi:single-stranded DNA-binding protein
MNSFNLTAVGNLARNPELSAKGDVTFSRFRLVGDDAATKSDGEPLGDVVASLWFLAFGPIATAIAERARKGDQLILEARVIAAHWTDEQQGKQHGHIFVVTGFRFGARRGEHGSPITCRCVPPTRPLADAALAAREETT